MTNLDSSQTRSSFALPLLPAVALGTIATILFYGLLLYGVIDQPALKRYCASHPSAFVAVWLGLTSLIGMFFKLSATLTQWRVLRSIDRMLDKLVTEGEDLAPAERALWLEARWLAMPAWQQNSWTGQRIAEIIERQIRRQHAMQLESDLQDLSREARAQQQAGLALVRTSTLVLPMLGIMGSLITLSQVLVQAESLAQSGIGLSVGLGSAVAPLVVSLFMTIPVLFMQQFVQRVDTALLVDTDEVIRNHLVEFLYQERVVPTVTVHESKPVSVEMLAPSRQATDDLLAAVHQLVEIQANIWARSIGEAQKQWATWSTTSADTLRQALCESLDKSLSQHALQIEKIQQEAGRQVDSRWQQWQITLSDQARVMHAQQKELVRQTEAIERLVASTCELKKTDDAIHERFANFELLDQLRQTTLGVGEAVAVLATSLERAGIIRGLPVKPRSARRPDEESDDQRKAA